MKFFRNINGFKLVSKDESDSDISQKQKCIRPARCNFRFYSLYLYFILDFIKATRTWTLSWNCNKYRRKRTRAFIWENLLTSITLFVVAPLPVMNSESRKVRNPKHSFMRVIARPNSIPFNPLATAIAASLAKWQPFLFC